MRIKRLELKAFGPFTDRTLDFSTDPPGLHVVYGPNEAGKSSSLRALQALLFGFPVRTGDNFLHPYDQLLVGGCLQGSDGRELTFYRRKRSKNSLFDQEDRPLDPAALNPFLHGLEQELFTTLYGIDHETLVRGGQGILDQQGEVGQALFSAGTGLASLKSVLERLELDGEGLFKPRGSNQEITVALARYRELQVGCREACLSGREWQEHQRALEDAGARLEEANRSRAGLNRERLRLERLRQALPLLGRRRSLLEKLAELGDVVVLPPDFGRRRQGLEQEGRDALNRLETARNRLRDLEEKRKGVSPDQGLLDQAGTIEELHQGLGQYRKARADRPLLDGRRIGCRTEAANLLKQIRPEISLDGVEALRPGLSKRKTIQVLGAGHEALLQGVRKAERLARTIAGDLETARKELRRHSPGVDCAKLVEAVTRAHRAGDPDGEIGTGRRSLESARKSCLASLDRLGLWAGPPELAGRLAVPLPETVRCYEEEFRSLQEERRRLQDEREQCESGLARLAEQLREIEYAAEVPAEDELTRFRSRRDHGWRLLRRQWLGGEDIAAESRDYDPEHPLPEAYERLVVLSDQTADRLYREADRVQKHASLKAGVEGIELRLAELGAMERQADSALAVLDGRWRDVWSPCALTPLSPREMQAWLAGFDKLRFQVEEADRLAGEVAAREAGRRELRALLTEELAALGERREFPGEQLSPLLRCAEELAQRMQGDRSRREALEGRILDLEHALEKALADREIAEEELGHWQSLWEGAMSPLGIGGTTPPAEAVDFIETLQGCFDKLKEADDFRKRIDGIDRDAREFEQAVLELAHRVAPDLGGLDAPQTISQLKSRLDRAGRDQAVLLQYAEEMEALDRDMIGARTELAGIEGRMATLRRLSGCETEEELNEAERRSADYLEVKGRLADLETTLARIAEGVSLADLEAQAHGIDPDELPGRIEGLTNEIEGRLDPEIRRLSEAIGREKSELARMDGSGRAAELAEESQQALAGIRRLTERYLRLKLAVRILRSEIERYRAENQDPVLKIASRYFSELTLGSFAGLRTDIDDQDRPVLSGVRPTGAWLQVQGMSSGTRDQLFLALRLATLEWRLQNGEPMPFIVDDILINFDDERSRATLKGLGDLSHKTQVILFTHHGRIVDAARALNGGDRVRIHQL